MPQEIRVSQERTVWMVNQETMVKKGHQEHQDRKDLVAQPVNRVVVDNKVCLVRLV